MKQQNDRPFYSEAIPKLKKTESYKNFYKPYRYVEGYPPFNKVALDCAFLTFTGEKINFSRLDQTHKEVIQSIKIAEVNNVPAYWLDKNLAEALMMSDLPEGIGKPALIMPHFFLILPTGLIKNPDGYEICWLSIEYLQNGQEFPQLRFKNQLLIPANKVDGNRIRWSSMIEGGSVYNSITEIVDSDEKISLKQGYVDINQTIADRGYNTDAKTELEFTSAIDKLAYQVLLYMQVHPNAIAEAPEYLLEPMPTKGTGFSKKQSEPKLMPRWIGRGYKHRTRQANRKDEENRREFKIHTLSWWRRGHWRSQRIGKREEGAKKVIFIPPVHIFRNIDNDSINKEL